MTRKRWSAKTEITPEVLKSREKRKWQIALRRYVIEKKLSFYYAPYFGLDIETLRKWIEIQFKKGVAWDDFGKKWQFDHIIPVIYFDFADEADLKLCWNFLNIRVNSFLKDNDLGTRLDVLAAKGFFEDLYSKTQYPMCRRMLDKINRLEISEMVSSESQQAFLTENRLHLDMIENYTAFEFELLNSGRKISEVKKEVDFLKKFGN